MEKVPARSICRWETGSIEKCQWETESIEKIRSTERPN